MTENKLTEEYFDWMYKLVFWNDNSYRKLLAALHDIPFIYSIAMDGNREADGINLRYRFGYENKYEDYIIAQYLDARPCSVLEVMVALCMRCEESIMSDPEIGDRTSNWFREMLESLGLDGMDDANFNIQRVENVVNIFLDRAYAPNGKGGLFTVKDRTCDMRNVEIWYQMCKYLDELPIS